MNPARKLLVVFVALTLAPAGLAIWLAWRLLEQDRDLAGERLREIRDRRADEVVQHLARSLAGLEKELGSSPPGTIKPLGGSLAYSPNPIALTEEPSAIFERAETAEFREGKPDEALAIYHALTAGPSPAVHAGAWMRLARLHRRAGRRAQALRAYRQLSGIRDIAVAGAPAGIAAQWAICSIHEESGARVELKNEGENLRKLLESSAAYLTRDVYEAYAEDAARWSGAARPVLSEALADAAASRASGRETAFFRGIPITRLEHEGRVLLLSLDYVRGLLPAGAVQVRLASQPAPGETLRRASDTGLPWTISVALADPGAEQKVFVLRRRLLFNLFGVLIVLGGAGGYLAWRLVRRELVLARMQADILAAVSHEFRTPLTSMRQVSAALSEGRVEGEDRRQAYYTALSRATERLQRLVETLLDFGRMESARMPYRMERLDLATLVSDVGDCFSREVSERGFTLQTEVPPGGAAVKGDAEALSRALWNLLDNAVKYSGESRAIQLAMSRNGTAAEVTVTDRGLGIPEEEQRDVFRKFFRGSTARERRIRGTGIGLAMVDHIVRAHSGRVTLRSKPGEGSSFTIALPSEE